MQVTELQVQRSLEALTDHGGRRRAPTDAADDSTPPDLPDGLVERLTERARSIRDDRVEEARRRLETGQAPTAEALAQRMVGRLVCDRLR